MGISNTRFGNRFAAAAATAATGNSQDKPKAKFWLNVGYPTDNPDYPFVALPTGIPLDASDMQTIRGKPEYAQLLSAQNDLLAEMIEEAETLAPGEDRIYASDDMPIAFQLRRVRDEQTIAAETNPLSRRGRLFGAAAPAQEEPAMSDGTTTE